MNLKADSGSEDVGDAFQSGIASGSLGMGLRHSLTTISYDLNVNSSGEARINLNSTNSSLSQLGLSEQTQAFIEAMQRNGRTIQNLSMLLNANERLQNEEGAEQEYSVELTDEEMETLFDNCTTIDQKYLPGLINVNTASVEVLEVLPGLDETDAEAIVDAREGLMSDQMTTPAWLIQQGTLDTEKFQAIYPYITTRSWQYHFYVAGYSIPSGRYCVLEVIADTAEGQPRTLMMRDLTRLGMPFKVETEESDNAVEDAA
jgi:DNA uptake protein ComE-like DNA-binding protein